MEHGEHAAPGTGDAPGPVGDGSADTAPTELEAHAADVMRAAEEAAAATGRAMVAEARGVRRRMLEDAERRRRELIGELERVRMMLDAAIEALRAEAPADQVSDAPTAPGSAPAPASTEPAPRPADGEGAQVGALFARLRSEPTPTPDPRRPKQPKTPTPTKTAGAAATPQPRAAEPSKDERDDARPDPEPEREPVPETEAGATSDPGDADSALRRRRAAVLEPLIPAVVRGSKRLLQDEQNTLLDSVRRARGRHEASRLLPDHEHQRDAWIEVLGPGVDGAYLGGRAAVGKTGRVTKAPGRVVAELVAVVVKPLRERLTTTIDSVVADGPYESPIELQRVIGSAIGARYREWKGGDLETHLTDVLCAAYARGSYDGAGPAAPLRWVPDEPGRCPDCDDNALEPTSKGGVFPTGQLHPPAHPGCRCLVVLAGDVSPETPRT